MNVIIKYSVLCYQQLCKGEERRNPNFENHPKCYWLFQFQKYHVSTISTVSKLVSLLIQNWLNAAMWRCRSVIKWICMHTQPKMMHRSKQWQNKLSSESAASAAMAGSCANFIKVDLRNSETTPTRWSQNGWYTYKSIEHIFVEVT